MQIDWQGRFGFTEENVKKLVQKKAGNYILLIKLQNGNERPVYVGKAENLEQRLLEHLSSNEPNPCLRKHVKEHVLSMGYCYVGLEEDRKNVENTLYHKYTHECNEKEPEGKITSINFPF